MSVLHFLNEHGNGQSPKVIVSRIAAAVTEAKRQYPYLVTDHVCAAQIEQILADEMNTEDWKLLKPLVASYAFLRVRGEHSTVAFMTIFQSDAEVDLASLPEAISGVPLIETLNFYQSEFNQQLGEIDAGQLWNFARAAETLDSIRMGSDDRKVIAACEVERASIEATMNAVIDRVLRGGSSEKKFTFKH